MEFPNIIFSATLDRSLGWTVVHSLWQVTLIAFLAGILLILFQHKPAQVRYWVANLALMSVLGVAAATFAWYFNHTPPPAESLVIAGENAFKPAKMMSEKATALMHKPLPSSAEKLSINTFYDYFNRNLPLVVLIWFVGMTFFLLKLLGSLLQVYNMRRRMNFEADPYWTELLERLVQRSGFPKSVALLESALVRSPLTVGHFKPVILFPIGIVNRLTEQEVEAILAHELVHILRRDYIFNILQSLIEVLFYFHPAIWWLSAQVRNEREHACDDRAVALLGNKINYAKALVAIQEMAFLPYTPALAFAGTGKNQLLVRVQRLFSQPKSNFNIMEKWIATALVACLVAVLAFGQRFQKEEPLPTPTPQTSDASSSSGIWEATFSNDSVYLTLSNRENNSNWVQGDDFPKSSFTNLVVADGETSFQMIRPAGKITFTGKIEGTHGYGRFEFEPNQPYRVTLEKGGIKTVDEPLMLMCFFADFKPEFLSNLGKMGFTSISKDDLQQLAAFRLDERAINQYRDLAQSLGQKNLTLEEIVFLRVANVTPEKVKRFGKIGYDNLDLETIGQWSLHNLEPAYIEQMNQLELGKLSGDDLLAAKIHGITPEFIQQANQLNLGKLDFEDILSLKIHNIDADFVRKAQNMGLGNLNLDQIMSLKIHNIDEAFVQNARSMGLGNLNYDDVLSMKIHNIDADFVKESQNLGLGKLSEEDIMSLKIHNIDAEFVKKAQSMGLGKLNLADIMNLKIHRIDADFVQTANSMNLGPLTLDDLMQLKIHGVTPDLAKTYRGLGFQKLTVEDLVSVKIHGVTPEFIQTSNQKGYTFPTLQEYADLKIRNEWARRRAQ